MENNKISITFDCDDADEVLHLSIVYELIHQSYDKEYAPSFSMQRLPDLLGHIADVIQDGLDENVWHIDDAMFEFTKQEMAIINKFLEVREVRNETS